jgi:hypothetical protein
LIFVTFSFNTTKMLLEQAHFEFPSLSFVDSVWSALDDVHSSDFQEAACECRPFLDEFTVGVGNEADYASVHTAPTFEADDSTLAKNTHFAQNLKSQSTKIPLPSSDAPSERFGQKVAKLPYVKGRPIGVTGYRFIHLHSFQTAVGRDYRGYSLRFPRVLG